MKMMSAFIAMILAGAFVSVAGARDASASRTGPAPVAAEYVILFVLEGLDQQALKAGPMPVLNRLVKEGAVTWSAQTISPPLRLPAMASLLTGLPVAKHGITWEAFEFSRGYPRPPTVFDYLDLSGGRDSAVFFMDESLYQLAKPEPYTDYQLCGPLKPDCTAHTVVGYIREYFRKAASGHGYGHAILSLPHFLVVHLPEPGRAGQAHGWTSKEYGERLRAADEVMGAVLDIYTRLGLLGRTAVFVTALNGVANKDRRERSADGTDPSRVPWIAWGPGIKSGYVIKQPMSIIDTGATVLRTLGLETHTEWDSRVIGEIFQAARPAQVGHGQGP